MDGIATLLHPAFFALGAALLAGAGLYLLLRRGRGGDPDVFALLRETDPQRQAAGLAKLGHFWIRLRARHRSTLSALVIPALAVVIAFSFSGFLWLLTPYAPRSLMRTHPLTCAQARALGYADAQRGWEGYFAHLDADGDGISCESLR